MAQLNHPNVVQIFDYGQEALTLFIIMEYLPLDSLQAYLDNVGVLNRGQATQVCLEVARGIQFMHQKKIIHRDLKPANILIAPTGVKVGDFGLVRSDIDQFQTHSQAIMGTFAFMSPEQRLGAKDVTHQTDIYALAASLYVMLTKASPLHLHRADERKRLFVNLDPLLVEIMERGLQPDRNERYATINEMIADLEHVLSTITEDSTFHFDDVEVKTEPQDLTQLMEAWRRFTTPGNPGAPDHFDPFSSAGESQTSPPPSYLLSQQIEGVGLEALLAPTYVPDGQTGPPSKHHLTPVQSIDLQSTSALSPGVASAPGVVSDSPLSQTSSTLQEHVYSTPQVSTTRDRTTPSVSAHESEDPMSSGIESNVMVMGILIALFGLGLVVYLNIDTNSSKTPPTSSVVNSTGVNSSASEMGTSQHKMKIKSPLERIDQLRPRDLQREAEQALLQGEYPLAEHFLHALIKKSARNAHAHLLLSVTSFLRRREYKSALYASLAVKWSGQSVSTDSQDHQLFSLVEKSVQPGGDHSGLIQQWRAFLEETPSSITALTYLILTRSLWPELIRTQVSKYQSSDPDALAFRHLGLLLTEQKNHELYVQAVGKLCHADQKMPVFVYECARVAEFKGELKEARGMYQKITTLDPNLIEARVSLAKLDAMADDESKRITQMMLSLSDTVWPEEQWAFLRSHGVDMAHRGRLNENRKLLEFCRAESLSAGDLYTAAQCIHNQLTAALWLGSSEDVSAARKKLEEFLEVEALEYSVKLYNMLTNLSVEAEQAAQTKRWSRFDEVRARIDQTSDADDVFGVKERLIKRLDFLSLMYRAHKSKQRKVLSQRQEEPSKLRSCLSVYEDSMVAAQIENTKKQTSALNQVINHQCLVDQMTPYIINEAQVTLSEVLLKNKRRREAQTLIQSFLARWKSAEPDLSISKRARKVFDQL